MDTNSRYEHVTLENKFIKVVFCTLGASIHQLYLKESSKVCDNIILSFKSPDDYYKANPYFGMTCGRHAGRIKNATFTIDGENFDLSKNDGENHLHGGKNALSNKIWDYKLRLNEQCTFFTNSNHLEEGYPGNVNIQVIYTLKQNQLLVEYKGKTDRPTLLNLTNHAYFNLSGKPNTRIYDHKLSIQADYYGTLDEDSIPKSKCSVENSYFDFREEKVIGDLRLNNHKEIKKENGINHPFIFGNNRKLLLTDPKSKRRIEINTSYPSVVIYSFNHSNREVLMNQIASDHIGLAVECQFVPNAINNDIFNQPITTIDNPYYQWISYTF